MEVTQRENEILEKIRVLLIDFYDPKRIVLFGSRAKGKNKLGSDFDFAVDTDIIPNQEKLFSLRKEIDNISGLYKIDVVFLSNVDDEFKQIILETGKVIYEKGS